MANPVGHATDFAKAHETDLHKLAITFGYTHYITRLHGCTANMYTYTSKAVVDCTHTHIVTPPPLDYVLLIPCVTLCPCRVTIPFKFSMYNAGLVHGLAFWFDVAFWCPK